MKKIVLTVALVVATLGTAQANLKRSDFKIEQKKELTAQDIVKNNDSTPHIISFYDVERLEVKNEKHSLIRIYDENWTLITETTDDVCLNVKPGNYYVACDKRIKTKYIKR